MAFKGNPPNFYDVGVWGKMGFACANTGPRVESANSMIRKFVQTIGRNLQAMMLHPDANKASPPSINTIIDVHKLVIRARDLISAESVGENDVQDMPVHNTPSFQPFTIYPTPFFSVRNQWMKSYCELVLGALSEMMQSSENDNGMEITTQLGGIVGVYLTKLYKNFCIELLKINPQDPNFPTFLAGNTLPTATTPASPIMKPNWRAFTLSNDQILAYAPSKWFTPTELIDTAMPVNDIPSAFDLLPVTGGIPATNLPPMGPFPFASNDSLLDSAADPATLKPTAGSAAATNPPPGSGTTAAQNASAQVQQVPAGGSTSAFPAPPGGLAG